MDQLNNYYLKFLEYITNEDRWITIGVTLLKIILLLIVAKILIRICDKAIDRIFIQGDGDRFKKIRLDSRRSQTMRTLVKNTVKCVRNYKYKLSP